MTVLELMERAGIQNETLAIAYIKDALHLIQSNTNNVYLCFIRYGDDNVYRLPADLIAIENISILDTSDSRYKRIKRISSQPHYLLEDTSP